MEEKEIENFDTQDEFETEELNEELENESEDEFDEEESDGIDWKARALKAEKAIISNKTKDKSKKSPSNKTEASRLDIQADQLRIAGLTLDEIEQLKKISAVEGCDLIDARSSELFQLWKQKREGEEKTKGASLTGSNRGRTITESLDVVKARVMSGKAREGDMARVLSGK